MNPIKQYKMIKERKIREQKNKENQIKEFLRLNNLAIE